ncbi:MAG TPA: MotA/TolQ/ExbB proton channel family protein [Elusimicrobiota bacterium]|nr:MotA/TolQ/ExbB proton channel family protein [Elusimicrobiota bacterium]
MDLMTVLGVLSGAGAIYYVLHHGGMLHLIVNLEAFILIFGGTLGSVLISYPWEALKTVPRALIMVLVPPRKITFAQLIYTFVQMAEKARINGLDSLQTDAAGKHFFLRDGVQMLLDGLEPEIVKERLEREILLTRQRHMQVTGIFRSAGTFAPIFGLLGTLIGVVQVLRNLTDPHSMGASMAIAMTASFYGIFAANFLFLPIASKLNYHSENELLVKELIAKGIMALQRGDIPLVVSKKLEAYLSYRLRTKQHSRTAAGAKPRRAA